MKNFIEVLDDDSLEDRIERSWNKNKKFLLPIVLIIMASVYAVGEVNEKSSADNLAQHTTSDEIIISGKYDVKKISSLNDFYQLRTMSSILAFTPPNEDALQLALGIHPSDKTLNDAALELKVNVLMDLDKPDTAIDLLTNHPEKTAIQWLQLGDLMLIKFDYDTAILSYTKARDISKTKQFGDLLDIKIQHTKQAKKGGK